MDICQKINAIIEGLDSEAEKEICREADRTLFNTMYAAFAGVSAKDVIKSFEGEVEKKEMNDMSPAMEAQRTLRSFGERLGIEIPLIEDRDEFFVWLMREYGFSVLRNT